jgi:hypothetical protein
MSRFGIVPASVFDDERMDAGLIAVLLLLSTYADRHGWCWPKQETLARQLRLSRTTTNGYVKRLVELGYVESRRERNGCCYRLLYDRCRPDRHQMSAGPTSDVDGADITYKDEQPKEHTIEQKTKGARLSPDFAPAADDLAWAGREYPAVNLERETEKFKNHWLDKPGAAGVKLAWNRAWRNWIINAEKDYAHGRHHAAGGAGQRRRVAETDEERRAKIDSALRGLGDTPIFGRSETDRFG